MSKVLVTGGAGFIGSHTIDYLLKQDWQVIVLDNLSSGQLGNLDLSHPDLEFVEGDVLEFPLVKDLLKDCDAVLHLAAIASVPLSIEEPIYSFQVNTQGLLHVLEAVKQLGRAIRVVYASSAAVYGNAQSLPCRDDVPLESDVLSPYALQKKHDEDYAKLYMQLHGLSCLGLRYFNVYGERQQPDSPYSGVISRFLDAYQSKKELTVFGDGQQSRDFICVTDVARANGLALESDYSGALNIATGKPETLLQLIEYIQKSVNGPARLHFEPRRVGDISASYAAVKMAQQYLEFESAISLESGVSSLVAIPKSV